MPEEIVGRILRLAGYGAYQWEFNESRSRLTILGPAGGSGPVVHLQQVRRWSASHPERPGAASARPAVGSVEGMAGPGDPSSLLPSMRCVHGEDRVPRGTKHPFTRRFAEAVARDCEDAAVRRVAVKWGASAWTVRRIDKRALDAVR